MSHHIVAKYKPAAVALLQRHGLEVPDWTVENIAKEILRAHLHGPRGRRQDWNVTPQLKKAAGRVRKLRKFAEKPPSRRESITANIRVLYGIMTDLPVAFTLTLTNPNFKLERVVTMLERGRATPQKLSELANVLDAVIANAPLRRSGRPWMPFTCIIRTGYIAWQRSTHKRAGYSWNCDRLTGPLPRFLRDFVQCCARGESESLSNKALKDEALRDAILACKKIRLSLIAAK